MIVELQSGLNCAFVGRYENQTTPVVVVVSVGEFAVYFVLLTDLWFGALLISELGIACMRIQK